MAGGGAAVVMSKPTAIIATGDNTSGQPIGTMVTSDPIVQRIQAFDRSRGGGVAVRRVNRGYSLYSTATGVPIARLRPIGKADMVQVLWWRRDRLGDHRRPRRSSCPSTRLSITLPMSRCFGDERYQLMRDGQGRAKGFSLDNAAPVGVGFRLEKDKISSARLVQKDRVPEERGHQDSIAEKGENEKSTTEKPTPE
jgi:hypothetical protein